MKREVHVSTRSLPRLKRERQREREVEGEGGLRAKKGDGKEPSRRGSCYSGSIY